MALHQVSYCTLDLFLPIDISYHENLKSYFNYHTTSTVITVIEVDASFEKQVQKCETSNLIFTQVALYFSVLFYEKLRFNDSQVLYSLHFLKIFTLNFNVHQKPLCNPQI